MTVTVLATGWDSADGASYDVITTNEGFRNRRNRRVVESFGEADVTHDGPAHEAYLHEETGEQFLMLNRGFVYEVHAVADGELEQLIVPDARAEYKSLRIPEGYVIEDVHEARAELVEKIDLQHSINAAQAGSTGDNEDDPRGAELASDEEE